MAKAIKLSTKDYLSGVFLIVALILFTTIPFYVNYIHSHKRYIHYYTYFNSTYGITKNAKIYYLEMPIGYVSKISIVDLNKIKMDIFIDKKYKNLIKEDSKISVLSTFGLNTILNGKGLQIISGKSKKLLKPNSKISSLPPQSLESMIKKFEIDKISKSLKHTIINIEKLTNQLTDRNGSFQQTINSLNRFSNKLATKPILKIALDNKDYYILTHLLKDLDKTILITKKSIEQIKSFTKNKDINTSIKQFKNILTTTNSIVGDIKFFTKTLKKNVHIKDDAEQIEDIIEQTDEIEHKINSIKFFKNDNIDSDEFNIQN